MILTRNVEEREEVRSWLIQLLNDQFPTVRSQMRLENGPLVGYPLQFRFR